jgi:Flp pilus assembly pilin Flp
LVTIAIPEIDERGATMVEFAISGVVLLFLIGALIDFGIGFQRWNMLNYVTSAVARQYAVELNSSVGGDGVPCGPFRTAIRDRTISRFNQQFGIHVTPGVEGEALTDPGNESDDYQVQVTLNPPPAALPGEDFQPMLLRLQAQLKLRCFFCIFIPSDIVMTTKSEIEIEDASFWCENT